MRCPVEGVDTYIYTGTKNWQHDRPWLLFIHGAANDHSVWALQSRYFAHHGWNVIAPDLPGHGLSEGAPLASIEAIAQWCNALLDACGAAHAAVAGHSMGSLVALALSGIRTPATPRRITHTALLGSTAPMAVSDGLLEAAQHEVDRANRMITQWAFSSTSHIGANKAPGMWMTGASLALMRRAKPGILHQDLLNCKQFAGALESAQRVSGRVLMISGARDLMTPAKSVAPLIAAMKANASVTLSTNTLPDCGHSMMSERPEEVLQALRHFFI
jgi:pimeloyl-ACP methyl ester carboxylesterase